MLHTHLRRAAGEVRVEVRFRNPYRFWIAGLLWELLAFGGFLLALVLLSALIRAVVG